LITESQNEGIFGRRRHAGSPRDRWEDEVRKNITKLLSTKNSRVKARHRRNWRENREGYGQETGHMKKDKSKLYLHLVMDRHKFTANIYW
jgi:hypothetical protein